MLRDAVVGRRFAFRNLKIDPDHMSSKLSVALVVHHELGTSADCSKEKDSGVAWTVKVSDRQ